MSAGLDQAYFKLQRRVIPRLLVTPPGFRWDICFNKVNNSSLQSGCSLPWVIKADPYVINKRCLVLTGVILLLAGNTLPSPCIQKTSDGEGLSLHLELGVFLFYAERYPCPRLDLVSRITIWPIVHLYSNHFDAY